MSLEKDRRKKHRNELESVVDEVVKVRDSIPSTGSRQKLRAQMVSALDVGKKATAVLRSVRNWASDAPFHFVDQLNTRTHITISDVNRENFLLPGEWVDVEWLNDLKIFKPIGANGLIRRAKVAADTNLITTSLAGFIVHVPKIVSIPLGGVLNGSGAPVKMIPSLTVTASVEWLKKIFFGDILLEATNAIIAFLPEKSAGSLATDVGEWVVISYDGIGDSSSMRVRIAAEDIAHNAEGDVNVIEVVDDADCGEFVEPTEPDTEKVCNALLPMVWKGSLCLVTDVFVPNENTTGGSGGSPSEEEAEGTTQKTLIVKAYSATQLWGLLKDDLLPRDGFVGVDTLTPLNGHFEPDGGEIENVSNAIMQEHGCTGMTALCHWDDDAEEWFIVRLKRHPMVRGAGVLTEDMCTVVAEPPIGTFSIKGRACAPDVGDIEFLNPLGLIGEEDDVVFLDVNLDDMTAEITNIQHKPANADELEYDSGTKTLSVIRRSFVAPLCDNQSTEDILEFTTQVVLSSMTETATEITFGCSEICVLGDPTVLTSKVIDKEEC